MDAPLTADAITMADRQPNRYFGALSPMGEVGRWVGRCRSAGCGGVRVDGTPLRDQRGDTMVLGTDGRVYTTRVLSDPQSINLFHDCGRWVLLRRVFDDGRPDSKRATCGARCTNATGPSCDCRCRGANHGSHI